MFLIVPRQEDDGNLNISQQESTTKDDALNIC